MIEQNSLPDAALYYHKPNGALYPINSTNKNLPILLGSKLGGRYCYSPQGEKVTKRNVFYSISSILKLTQDTPSKEALNRWKLKVGEEEAESIRNEAIKAGNAIHSYLHSYLTEAKPKPIIERHKPYYQALVKILPNFGDLLFSEQLIVSFRYQYLGKFDHLGFYRKLLTVSDFKTALKPKSSLEIIQDKLLQLAAYYIPIKALYPVEQAALIYLISNGSCNEFVFTPDEMEIFSQLWLERLSKVQEEAELAA